MRRARNTLSLAVAPLTSSTGTPRRSARARDTCWLARPASGGAATRILTRPSCHPLISVRDARGTAQTRTSTPSGWESAGALSTGPRYRSIGGPTFEYQPPGRLYHPFSHGIGPRRDARHRDHLCPCRPQREPPCDGKGDSRAVEEDQGLPRVGAETTGGQRVHLLRRSALSHREPPRREPPRRWDQRECA